MSNETEGVKIIELSAGCSADGFGWFSLYPRRFCGRIINTEGLVQRQIHVVAAPSVSLLAEFQFDYKNLSI